MCNHFLQVTSIYLIRSHPLAIYGTISNLINVRKINMPLSRRTMQLILTCKLMEEDMRLCLTSQLISP